MVRWKEYGYSGEFSQIKGDIVYRPMIGLKISNKDQEHNCLSLIDSGTDSTIIDADFAELLGIDESSCPKIKVGSIEKSDSHGFISKVKMQIEGFSEEFETEVIFLKNMAIGGLLGQKDILQAVVVRQIKPSRRKDGSYVRFDENAVVILEKGKKEPLAGRVFGPIPREIQERGFQTIASHAAEIV